MPRVQLSADPTALAHAAAERVVQLAAQAHAARGRFVLCVSGGQTPRAVYELLATPAFAQRVDWARTELCFGDERCVPPDDPASNYRMVSQAMLRHVPLPFEQIHRIAGEQPPAAAALAYEARLKALLGVSKSTAPARDFDLVLLGLGADGHTASLFPNSVDADERWVCARAAQPVWRVTLTPLALNASRVVLFLVSGQEKAAVLSRVLSGQPDPVQLPAQRIAPAGDLRWLVDRAAAARLDPSLFVAAEAHEEP